MRKKKRIGQLNLISFFNIQLIYYYLMSGEKEKKQFNYPKRQEVIQQIKALDDQIEHVSLNLIKCNFDANEKDVEKTFPEFKFIKVKNYNPGSFQLVFQMKIDAINFIRNCYDRKILNRRFFIKMGRQHKQVLEDWACIGQVPKKFNNYHKKGQHHNKDHHKKGQHEHKQHQGEHRQHRQPRQNRQHRQHKQHREHREHREHRQPREQRQPRPQKKVEQKQTGQVKTETNTAQTKNPVKTEQKPKQAVKQTKQVKQVKQTKQAVQVKQQAKQKPKAEKAQEKKQQPKKQDKKSESKPAEKKQVPKASEQTKAEDDGWITVPATKGKKR